MRLPFVFVAVVHLALLTMPVAVVANHGSLGAGTASLDNGATYIVAMQYEQGFADLQEWDIRFEKSGSSLHCTAIGSIEGGFRSGNDCDRRFRITGTGHEHSSTGVLDHHEVALTFDGLAGTLDAEYLL